MSLNEWFEKGLTPESYINTMEDLKDGHETIDQNYQLPEDEAFFQSIKDKNLRVIVLAEVWCGHCMLNIPILLKIAHQADMSVRILPRDQNLELMDQYLTNGNRTIPIFIFIDENGNEVAKWGPMAEKTRAFVTPLREKLPAKDAEDYEEKFGEMVKITSKAFRENVELWNGVYESIKQTLTEISS